MESRKTNLLGILFSICVILVLSVGLTIALHSITPTSANVNEDVFRLYNITVNNTGVLTADGITQVNITVPPTFLFLDGSNGTNAGAPTFTNTSTVLSWSNASGTAMVANITFNYFFFNASASTPGTFNITLTTSNSTYTSFSNISVSVNDTTSPSAITFVSPSESAGANLSRNKTGFNITATDNGVVDSVRVYLYNATSLVNNTNVSGAFAYVNFTGLADGTYSV
ncbi:MAG: hypothetical protein Q7S74_02430, partial [Nanoarchaeota archaeon]|nr:hypothetical protein [Nanoarchaeota archaeon]